MCLRRWPHRVERMQQAGEGEAGDCVLYLGDKIDEGSRSSVDGLSCRVPGVEAIECQCSK